MKKIIIIIITLIIFCPYANAKDKYVILDKDHSEFTIDLSLKEGVSYQHNIEKYVRNYLYMNKKDKYFLIKQRVEFGKGPFEGYNPAKITVSSYGLDLKTGKIQKKAFWRFVSDGIIEGIDPFCNNYLYWIKKPGCCGAPDINKYYSLNTGKLIASTTHEIIKIYNAETREYRYLGIEDEIISEKSEFGEILTTLTYSDENDTRQKFDIIVKGIENKNVEAKYFQWTLVNLEILNTKNDGYEYNIFNKKDFSGVDIKIKFKCSCDNPLITIIIPIINDHIDYKTIKYEGAPDISFDEDKDKTTNHVQ